MERDPGYQWWRIKLIAAYIGLDRSKGLERCDGQPSEIGAIAGDDIFQHHLSYSAVHSVSSAMIIHLL